jgi:hypothetical protein
METIIPCDILAYSISFAHKLDIKQPQKINTANADFYFTGFLFNL